MKIENEHEFIESDLDQFDGLVGIPRGTFKAIKNLSDPPVYTACPNPWLDSLIPKSSNKESKLYTPYVSDVEESKNNFIYKAHSYHTKTPHRAIMRYILHHTEPGDVIFDGFCGSGSTGIAASMCGDRKEVASLGYTIDSSGKIRNEAGDYVSMVGERRAILIDLSPAATFLAYNHNTPFASDYVDAWDSALSKIDSEFLKYYATLHAPSDEVIEDALSSLASFGEELDEKFKTGVINYTVWSDVFSCGECGGQMTFWDAAVQVDLGIVVTEFPCPHCNAIQTKRKLNRVTERIFDVDLNETVSLPKQSPVLIEYSYAGKRHRKTPDRYDLALVDYINDKPTQAFVPTAKIPDGDKTPEATRLGYTHSHHFFTRRNLAVFSAFREELPPALWWVITGALLRGSKQHQIAISRIGGPKASEGGATAGHRRGTLYIPSNQVEMNAITLIKDRYRQTARARNAITAKGNVFVSTQSCTSVPQIPNDSIDYIFLDPPFGDNIMYSELSFIWESWLNVFTNSTEEAIENKTQAKSLASYRDLMSQSFAEVYRILKPGGWMTVEFSNTKASVWNAIQAAISEAGFVVSAVSALNKGRGGLNAIVGVTAVKQDLVISAYKPDGQLELNFTRNADTPANVWHFVDHHLTRLQKPEPKNGIMEFVAERDPRILFDRMVAFFVCHETPVPISTGEFQEELHERYAERDGMIFLADQVAEYDTARAKLESVGQLTIFVEDEKSAINWIRNFLKKRPSTYQDIQPEFMQQLSASWKKWESRPELSFLLDQAFLQYKGDGPVPSQIHNYLSTQFKNLRNLGKEDSDLKAKAMDRWFVPDPSKQKDMDDLRERRLLEEFWSYLPPNYVPPALSPSTGGDDLPGLRFQIPKIPKGKKMKELRTEAIRAGFRFCYQKKDYQTMLVAAQIVPDAVIEEDTQLQMFYDTAVTRSGVED